MGKTTNWLAIGKLIGETIQKVNEAQKDGKITTQEVIEIVFFIIKRVIELFMKDEKTP